MYRRSSYLIDINLNPRCCLHLFSSSTSYDSNSHYSEFEGKNNGTKIIIIGKLRITVSIIFFVLLYWYIAITKKKTSNGLIWNFGWIGYWKRIIYVADFQSLSHISHCRISNRKPNLLFLSFRNTTARAI